MAIRNFTQVRRHLRRIERGISTGTRDLAREHMIFLSSRVVVRTPVLTGAARSTWEPGFSRPVVLEEPGIISRSPIQGRIKAQVAFRRFRLGQTMTLANGIAYIGLLDDGFSPQAPDGFTQQSAAAAALFTANRVTVTFRRIFR